MNQELIVKHLHQWMKDFIEQPNEKLNGWAPCPYARQSRINNKIQILFNDPAHFDQAIDQSIDMLQDKEAVIVVFDHTLITHEDLTIFVRSKNLELNKDNVVILRDHPDDPEYINDVKMNFDLCGLLVIQQLSELKKASVFLESKGYYNSWNTETYQAMTAWR
jgi:hypothetical protein